MKLYAQLGEMTFAVDRINGVRLELSKTAPRNFPTPTPLRARLRTAASQVDELRKKIVATKEGGMITGEERLREFLTELYGSVVFYEGCPSQAQEQHADALARELGDVEKDFDAWTAKELSGLNSELTKKNLEPLKTLTREEWEKTAAKPTSSPSPNATRRDRDEF